MKYRLPHTCFLSLTIGLGIAILLSGFQGELYSESAAPGPGVKVVPFGGPVFMRIAARKKIIIGIQKDYQPFHIEDGNKSYPGLDIEIGQKLAETLGVKAKFQFMPIEGLIEAAGKGEVDISLGGLSSNLERVRLATFSDPYLLTTPAALVDRNVLLPESESVDFPRQEIQSLGNLKKLTGLIIGVKANTTNEALLNEDEAFLKHEIVSFPDQKTLMENLLAGKINTLVADELYIKSQSLKYPELLNRFIPVVKIFRKEHICMALPRGDAEFILFINFFIKEIKRTGFVQNLEKRYFESNEWVIEDIKNTN